MKSFLSTIYFFSKSIGILWCLPAFLLLAFPGYALRQSTRNYTLRDGLPDTAVQAVYKDSRGLLWIGTQSGLCSFDGKSFRTYMPSDGIPASQVWAIAEDAQGNMWFGSMGEGLFKFDGKIFSRYTEKDGLVDDRIRVLCYSKKFDCMVAGSYDGVNIIKNDTILKFENRKPGEKYGTITGLADAGDFILVSEYGSRRHYRLYPGEGRFIGMEHAGDYYPPDSFSCYVSSKGDTIISDTYSGVRIYNNQETNNLDFPGQVFSIAEDKRGDLWMASWAAWHRDYDGGVFRYDGKTVKNYKDIFGIEDREIWTLYYDPEQDILWIGTLNQGLFMVQFPFVNYYTPKDFGLESQDINNLFVDSGNRLWISSEREIITLKPDGTYYIFRKELLIPPFRKYWHGYNRKSMPVMSPLMNGLFDLTDGNYSDLLKLYPFKFDKVMECDDGNLILACEPGTYHMNKSGTRVEYMGLEGHSREFVFIGDTMITGGPEKTSIIPDYRKANTISYTSILQWEERYRYFDENNNPRNVNRMLKRGNKIWYAASTGGLWLSEGMRLINFNRQDTTISYNLRDICVDEEGRILFASATGEICVADLMGDSLIIRQRINAVNGLQGTSVNWIALAGGGKLWAGTNKGLNLIALEKVKDDARGGIRFFDEEDGYDGQQSKKAVVDHQGNLWIASNENLIRINYSDFDQLNFDTGSMVLKSLEINDNSKAAGDSARVKRWYNIPDGFLRLSHNENNLIFTFDKFNFRNPDKDIFRYRLSGFQDNFTFWNKSRRAIFTNLPPGTYTLVVESYNQMTDSLIQPLEIGFTIRHPWWGLWYVKLLSFVFLTGLLISWIRKYIRLEQIKQQTKSEIEKKIVRLEMQALQAQMNPHFIFNCVNGIQYYVLANKMDEVLVYLSDFSKVVRESLENATQKMVPLELETTFLKSYLRLELMRFPDKFDYEIMIGENVDSYIVLIPPMLVQPFVENSIRHGFMKLDEKGRLSIKFESFGKDVLKCTVTDNGIGRMLSMASPGIDPATDRLHSGQITEARLRLFNPPGNSEKYRVVYTDLTGNGFPSGLKVELYLPKEMAYSKTSGTSIPEAAASQELPQQ